MCTTKMDKKKRLCVFVFCLLQVAFILCFLGLFVQKITPVWVKTADYSVRVLPQDGSSKATAITVNTYSPFMHEFLPAHMFQAQSCEGENRIRAAYFAREFESINASYISRANAVFEPQYRVLHRSASSFCYQISGAPNGEVLEVWACNVSNGAPYVCTHPVEGGARA